MCYFLWIHTQIGDNINFISFGHFHKLARIDQYQLYYLLWIYFTNWQEIMIAMLVRGDAFLVFIHATLLPCRHPREFLILISVPWLNIQSGHNRSGIVHSLKSITQSELSTASILKSIISLLHNIGFKITYY